MKPLKILVDIDDTIENLCEVWVDILNERYNRSVKYEDVTEWDISKFFPGLTKEQVFEPLHQPDIWNMLSPKEGAMYYLKKLIEDGHDVYLCTSTDYRNVYYKYVGVIQRLFPFIDWNHVIVIKNKQMLAADFLIDDAPHNLEGGVYIKILMTAPHNKSYDVNGKGMIRCDSWDEIYQVIHEYVVITMPHIHSIDNAVITADKLFGDAEREMINMIKAEGKGFVRSEIVNYSNDNPSEK